MWKPLECIKPKQKQEIPLSIDVKEINDFFIKISTKQSTQTAYPLIPRKNNENFQFQPITETDIRKIWKQMKNPKKCSPDPLNISNKMIDMCIINPHFTKSLFNLFNSCIYQQTFPKCLKTAKIIPIPKIPNPTSPNDMRPISIQPVVAKIFEKCLYDQLSTYIFTNKIITKTQFGYQPAHSTTHALIALTDHLHDQIVVGNISIIIGIDIAKGFDTADRDIILTKLQSIGVDEKLLKSYMNDRQQFTTIIRNGKNYSSNTKSTDLGIVQGASLSGLLFIILMNDLPEVIKNSLTISYADDTQVIVSGPPHMIKYLQARLEKDLQNVAEWMQMNNLKLNVNKTQMLIIGRPTQVSKLNNPEIIFQNEVVNRVYEMKVLGIIIDDKLEFTSHTSNVSKKCNGILAMLFPLRDILSFKCKSILVNALIMSIINYGCIIYFNQTKKNQNVIMGLIRRASRYISRKRYRDSTRKDVNEKHKWLTPKYRFIYELCKFAHSTVHETAPEYFHKYLNFQNFTQKITRTRTHNVLQAQPSKTIKNKATKEWMDLPEEIKNIKHTTIFKRKLYDFILSTQTTESTTISNEEEIILLND
jgi:hypothetical protein